MCLLQKQKEIHRNALLHESWPGVDTLCDAHKKTTDGRKEGLHGDLPIFAHFRPNGLYDEVS